MADAAPAAGRKRLLLTLAVAAALCAAAAAIAAARSGLDWRGLPAAGMALVARGGPWVFFLALALAPLFGVPTILFSIIAASLFAKQMGMGGVVAASIAALTANLTLAYWLARSAFRPRLIRLLARLGHRLPEVPPGDITDWIIILRVTTGVPFFVQNYLLGLADAPFPRYFWVSCIFVWPSTLAWTVFGDALLHGRGAKILLWLGLIVALVAATHLVRRHWKGRSHAEPRGAA